MKYYDYLTEFVFREDEPQVSDLILIPGSGYGELAIRAAELYHAGYAERIAVSGKYSTLKSGFEGPISPERYLGERFETECGFLSRVLQDEGVPDSAILQECQAAFTYENAIYTRKLLEGTVGIPGKAILVCQAFHAKRCLLYYQLVFPGTEFLVCPAQTQGITRGNWYLDGRKIDVVLGEVQRIGVQFEGILKGTDTVWKERNYDTGMYI